jgi:hypothetical protein
MDKKHKVLLRGSGGQGIAKERYLRSSKRQQNKQTATNQQQHKEKTHSHAPTVKGMSLLSDGYCFCGNRGCLSGLEGTTGVLGKNMTPFRRTEDQ